jgi:hypothetical protein
MREKELIPYARTIDDALTKYHGTRAVTAAHQVGAELLRYTPTPPVVSSSYLKAAELFTMLRNQGITGAELVRRICITWAFVLANPSRYPDAIAEDTAFARGAMRLVCPNYTRPGARPLRHMGGVIRRDLGLFVLTLFKRLDDDAEAQRSKLSSQAFDEAVS